jgi:hypothetical protein
MAQRALPSCVAEFWQADKPTATIAEKTSDSKRFTSSRKNQGLHTDTA